MSRGTNKLFLMILFTGLSIFPGCGLPAGIGPPPPFATITQGPVILPSGLTAPLNPQIVADGNNHVFIVWQDINGISYAYSPDGGLTFPPQYRFPVPGSTGGTFPRVATDGSGNAFVTWFTGSNNGSILLNYAISNVFQGTIPVSISPVPFPSAGISPPEDIFYGNNSLLITWSQCTATCNLPSNYEVFANTTTLSGTLTVTSITSANFTTSTQVSGTASPSVLASGFAGYPKIRQFSAIPYILYQKQSPSGIFLSILDPILQKDIKINNSRVSSTVSLEINNSGKVYTAWNPSGQKPDIFTSLLSLGGTAFTAEWNVSNNGNSYGPAMGLDSSQYPYIAFLSVPGGGTTYDVFLTRSSDGGAHYPYIYNMSNTIGNSFSYAPGLAIVGKTGYLVWDDNTTGSRQIYFEKFSLN